MIVLEQRWLRGSWNTNMAISNRAQESTPVQSLRSHSEEQYPLNFLHTKRHIILIWLLQRHFIYWVCHVETKTIWAIVIWTIYSVTVFTICCHLKRDENSTQTEATLWHGCCQLKSCSATDWQRRHFMVAGHSFWVLCLKLDLSPCPSPMKCLNISLYVLSSVGFDFRHSFFVPFFKLSINGIGPEKKEWVGDTTNWCGQWFDFQLNVKCYS